MFYEEHFTEKLEAQNARNKATGHPERNMTAREYCHSKLSRPEDKILQIGDMREHATGEELWECALEYKDRFNELYGDHCVILDMALHLDEATPHVHVRRVWIAEDENGMEMVNQTKALEQLGVPRPNGDEPPNRLNNAKITFTYADLELFRNICIEKGLDIDAPNPQKAVHLDTLTFKKKKISEEIEELEERLSTLKKQIGDVDKAEEVSEELQSTMDKVIDYFNNEPFFLDTFGDEIEEAKKKATRAEQFEALANLYKKAMENQIESTESIEVTVTKTKAQREINSLKRFIKAEGLMEKYMSFAQDEHTKPQSTEREFTPQRSFF